MNLRKLLGRLGLAGLVAFIAVLIQRAPPTYAVILLVLPVAALFVLVNPGLFLLLSTTVYSLLLVVLQGVQIASIARANQLLIGMMCGLLALRILFDLRLRHSRGGWSLPHILAVAFLLWALLRTAGSQSRDCYPAAGRLLIATIFLFVGYHFAARYKRHIWASVAVLSLAASSTSLAERLVSHDSLGAFKIGALRTGGSVGGAVATAAAVFVGTPVFFDYLLNRNRSRLSRIVGAIGLLGILSSVATTLTRAYMLGLLVFGVLFILVVAGNVGWTRKRQVLVVALPATIVIGALLLVPDRYVEARFQDLGALSGGGVEDRVGSGRGRIWREALASVQELGPSEIVVGRGLTTLNDALERRLGYRKDAHNSYIQVFYDLGAVGFLLYIAFLGSVWHLTALRVRSKDPDYLSVGLWHAYFGAYVLSFLAFNAYVYSGPPNFFSFLGVGAALGLRTRIELDGGGEENSLKDSLSSLGTVPLAVGPVGSTDVLPIQSQ